MKISRNWRLSLRSGRHFEKMKCKTFYGLYNGVPLVFEDPILKMDLSSKINQMKNTINSHNNDADDGFDPNF